MDVIEKAKRLVSKSRKQKKKHGSVKRTDERMKSKCRKSKKKKSSTTSKSNSAVSPHHDREERKEEKKESIDKKVEPHQEKKKSDRRAVEFKEEKEPESESDNDREIGMKRSHVVLPNRKGKPQKVAIKHRDVDEKEMEKLLKKLEENKAQPPRTPVALDEKSKLFMDRVEKKSYPTRYANKNKWDLLVEDDSEFFKPTVVKKKSSATIVPVEDSYDYVPKLADILRMPGENVYQMTLMGEVPFWAVYLDPDENDLIDVEPPISVGKDHVQGFQNRTITLKAPKSTKLVLDEFQPSCLLATRDEKFFHPHLIFSNTVRSLINVQGQEQEKSSMVKSPLPRSDDEGENEESTQPDGGFNVVISKELVKIYCYERSSPILSARMEKERLTRPKPTSPKPESPKVVVTKSPSTNLETEGQEKVKKVKNS